MSKVNASVKSNMKGVNNSSTYAYDNGERRIIDPVVAKLKEARRLEKEKKEKELREKKGLAPKSKPKPKLKSTIPMRTSGNSNLPKKDKSKSKSPVKDVKSVAQPRRPVTKMNFNDLMKKATSIDQSKLTISFKSKSKSPENTSTSTRDKYKPKSSSDRSSKVQNSKPPLRKPMRPESNSTKVDIPAKLTAPIPTRKPSEKLAAKLKQKQESKQEEDFESDMDSFIASDEEDYQKDVGYDRDEIWKMFNKGKSRSDFRYDDYDSDDMEATGAEIFDEELRSKRRAELEDRRELEEEQRRAEMKRQRKMKQGR
ncbi:protein Spt2p [[Candida] jaroonii]|uniref:Protein Spt2p n=1 Tax=[Candida] jaroonii TaxID=467808 RepID=A0ACA9Y0E1_9ASCO|nr:protein Spt2p [[Candida] jaroonii]